MVTKQQWEAIREIQGNLRQFVGGFGGREIVTEDIVMAIMHEYSANLDYDTVYSICSRIFDGMEAFCQFYNSEELEDSEYRSKMLDRITERMGQEGQRKGFYLQCLDSFGQNNSSPEERAERAALTEQELKDLLINRMQEFAQSTMAEMKEISEDYGLQEENGDSRSEDAEIQIKNELALYAAAEYLASLNGILPLEFSENPELLGIAAAAQIAMAEHGNGLMAKNVEWYEESDIAALIIITALGAAFTIGAVLVGIAAEAVLAAMGASTLGIIMGITLEVGWCIALSYGLAAMFCGIAFLAEAGIRKLMENRKHKEENADSKAAASWKEEASVKEEEFLFQS